MDRESRKHGLLLQEDALRDYLRGDSLRIMGSESSFGLMCSRLELFGPIRPCPNCGGRAKPSPTAGRGFVPVSWTRYNRKFEALQSYYTALGEEPPDDLDLWAPDDVKPCPKCLGYGWLPMSGWYETAGWPKEGTESAFPRHEKQPTGRLVDDQAMAVSGKVSRWLYAVFRQNPEDVQVLVALCGPDDIYGQKEPYFNVWKFCAAGKKLNRDIDALAQLWIDIGNMTIPHPEAPLVKQAKVEAARLVQRACDAWNAEVQASEEAKNGKNQ